MRCIPSSLLALAVSFVATPATALQMTFGSFGGWEAIEIDRQNAVSGCYVQRQSSYQSKDFSGYGSKSTWLKYNFDRKRIEFFSANAPFLADATFLVVGPDRYRLRIDGIEGWLDGLDNRAVFDAWLAVDKVSVVFGRHAIDFDTAGLKDARDTVEEACARG